MRRIKCRTSSAIFGLPTRCGRERHLQNKRYPARCQATTVSGEPEASFSKFAEVGPRTDGRSNAVWDAIACACTPPTAVEARLLPVLGGGAASRMRRHTQDC